MSRTRILIAAIVLTPLTANAYPIRPQTLWDLTLNAELVVLANVASVDLSAASNDEKRDSVQVARLEVIETWKGAPTKIVEVSFNPNVICPAPAKYIEGRRVVAFLRRHQGRWLTEGRSYGTRYPTDAVEEADLAEAVKGAATELSLGAQVPDLCAPGPAKPTIPWALLAASGRATRWDGLYALGPASDPAHAFYDRGRGEDVRLTPETLAALETIFVAKPSYDATLPQMLRLLRGRSSPAVTQAAADALETVLRSSSAPSWADEAIDLLRERLDGSAPRPVVPADPIGAELQLIRRERAEKKEVREERVQTAWDAFKEKYRLNPRPRDDHVRRLQTGTGPETPF